MESKPLYIFDLDGTLAVIDHRLPYLADPRLSRSERWRKFFAACVDDQPNWPVIRTLQALRNTCDVWIWSGRSSEVHAETIHWLEQHVGADIPLRLRDEGDHSADFAVKLGWLRALNEHDRTRLVAIYDDRQSVVDAWRAEGITVFQVAPGDR